LSLRAAPSASTPGSSLSPAALDVVVVPDFSGKQAMVFEERMLLFLASWLEHGAGTRGFPLHLACIGRPPARVVRLAARCDASITTHEPVIPELPYANKLRGLEISGEAPRILLLDADIVVLADPSGVARLPAGIVAGPPDRSRVPDSCWERIYPALGLAVPTERGRSATQEYALRTSSRAAAPVSSAPPGDIPPYYNSGVLIVPRDCGLRPVWEADMREIASRAEPGDRAWRSAARMDQTGLATAIERLKRGGVPVSRLPDAYNVRVIHLYTRNVTLSGATLFHATLVFKGRPAGESFERKLRHYRLSLYRRILGLWRRDRERRFRPTCVSRQVLPSLREVRKLVGHFEGLYRKHVAPARGAS
jgi:hypothetical protein